MGYVGAAATKALFIGVVILITASFFVDLTIAHPVAMLAFLAADLPELLPLLGFIIGIWARNFEQLQLVPLLVVTPLVFPWRIFLLDLHAAADLAEDHPVQSGGLSGVGFRWSFFGTADVPVAISLLAIGGFTVVCLGVIGWIFKTGWRIRS